MINKLYKYLPKKLKIIVDEVSKIIHGPNNIKKKDVIILKKMQRYRPSTINFNYKKLYFTDSASLLFIYDEIFIKQIYKFNCKHDQPVIIDAGANIGLSVIYFKLLFPKAKIIAFEPDNEVFNTLKKNIDSFSLTNVNIINKGLWFEETELSFHSEGADAGRITIETNNSIIHKIKTTKLSEYLNQNKIDLLKIDIEGAEYEVLKECKQYLTNVNMLFVEYHSFTNKPQELNELIQFIRESGLRIININVPGKNVNSPFIETNIYAGMDLQLNIYAIR